MKTRGLTTVLAIVALLGMAMTAQATIVIDSWKIDLSGISGMGKDLGDTDFGNIADIDELAFLGINHSVLQDDGDFIPEVGEVYQVDGALVATTMTGGGFPRILTTTGKQLNIDFEITIDFRVDGVITSINPVTGVVELAHLAPVGGESLRGTLNIYVDDLTDAVGLQGNTELNPGNGVGGSGITDVDLGSILIATFNVRAGDGGLIDPFGRMDGFDDGVFDFVSGLSGVLFDENGNDLTLGVLGDQFIAITDSNYDMDPDHDGLINSGPPTGWGVTGFANQGGGTGLLDFYAREDGSAVFGVPEPGSVVVWSLLLAVAGSLGFYRRKK